jgi:hypothetical protein
MVDSGQAHVEELRTGPRRIQAEGAEGFESVVGGGIATSTFNDDVSGVEEMDESQEVSENQAEPLQNRWYGMDDIADAERFAALGTIDATRPTTPRLGSRRSRGADPHWERPYSSKVLGGIAILGDGALATELLASLVKDASNGALDALKASLNQGGVAASEVSDLARIFDDGGAVLAVAEAPGRVPIHEIESLVEASGGQFIRTFVQPSD